MTAMTLNRIEKALPLLSFQTELLSERVRLKQSAGGMAKLLEITVPTYNNYQSGNPNLRKWEKLGILTFLNEQPTPNH